MMSMKQHRSSSSLSCSSETTYNVEISNTKKNSKAASTAASKDSVPTIHHESRLSDTHYKSSKESKQSHYNPDTSVNSARKSSSEPKEKSVSKSQHKLKSTKNGSSSTTTSDRRKRAPSEPLTTYLQDTTHTNPGYSTAYTNELIYNYGFPEEPEAQQDLESEIVREAKARIRASVSQYGDDV